MNPSWCHWMRFIIRDTNIYVKEWGCERFLSYTGVVVKILWWRGEYSADDNTVRNGLDGVNQKYCKLRT